jgi:hypothetical protein
MAEMRIGQVKSVTFNQPVYMNGSVRTTVALKDDTIESPAIGGVFRAEDIQAMEYGIGFKVKNTRQDSEVVYFFFLVPWPSVASIIFEDYRQMSAPPPVEKPPMELRIDPVSQRRR